MLPSNTNMLIHNGNPMLNVEQYKRYLALQTRLRGNSMLNVEEYSEYVQLHTQFQDSICRSFVCKKEEKSVKHIGTLLY